MLIGELATMYGSVTDWDQRIRTNYLRLVENSV